MSNTENYAINSFNEEPIGVINSDEFQKYKTFTESDTKKYDNYGLLECLKNQTNYFSLEENISKNSRIWIIYQLYCHHKLVDDSLMAPIILRNPNLLSCLIFCSERLAISLLTENFDLIYTIHYFLKKIELSEIILSTKSVLCSKHFETILGIDKKYVKILAKKYKDAGEWVESSWTNNKLLEIYKIYTKLGYTDFFCLVDPNIYRCMSIDIFKICPKELRFFDENQIFFVYYKYCVLQDLNLAVLPNMRNHLLSLSNDLICKIISKNLLTFKNMLNLFEKNFVPLVFYRNLILQDPSISAHISDVIEYYTKYNYMRQELIIIAGTSCPNYSDNKSALIHHLILYSLKINKNTIQYLPWNDFPEHTIKLLSQEINLDICEIPHCRMNDNMVYHMLMYYPNNLKKCYELGWPINKRLLYDIISSNPSLMSMIPERDRYTKLVLLFIKKAPELFKLLSKEQINTRRIARYIVMQNGMNLQFITNEHINSCVSYDAVNNNGLSLQYVQKQTINICYSALINNEDSEVYIKKELYDSVQELYKNSIHYYLRKLKKKFEIFEEGFCNSNIDYKLIIN